MTEDKKQLYPWLREIVENERYGVHWIDKDKQMFCIPWVHKNNPAWNETHGQIFKAWAILKNNYKEGEENWSRWKTNLRVALHKLSDFEEVKEKRNTEKNVDKPYRVYRFVTAQSESRGAENLARNSQDSCQVNSSSKASNDSVPCHVTYQNSDSNQSQISDCSPSNLPLFDALSPNFDPRLCQIDLENNENTPEHFICQAAPNSNGMDSHSQKVDASLSCAKDPTYGEYSLGNVRYCEGQNIQNFLTTDNEFGSFPSDLKDIQGESLMPKLLSREREQMINDLGSLPSDIPAWPIVHYEIYYLDEVVKNGSIGNDKHYLYIGPKPECLCFENPNRMEQIEFPDIYEIKMQRNLTGDQRNEFDSILSPLKREGFFLQFDEEGNIYAKRLGKSRIYIWSFLLQNFCLDKTSEEPTKVFDLNDFNGNVKESPCTILCFAQQLKAETFGKLVIHMKLTSVAALKLQREAGLLTEDQSTSSEMAIDVPMSVLSLKN